MPSIDDPRSSETRHKTAGPREVINATYGSLDPQHNGMVKSVNKFLYSSSVTMDAYPCRDGMFFDNGRPRGGGKVHGTIEGQGSSYLWIVYVFVKGGRS